VRHWCPTPFATVLLPPALLQAGLHEVWGGVKPDVARDAHAAAITGTVDGCLEDAGVKPQDLTAVAVTVGPGLSICLQVREVFLMRRLRNVLMHCHPISTD
jgi:N6-L-threonylcarbamoyladenine synthase